jgi:hypothetical protein
VRLIISGVGKEPLHGYGIMSLFLDENILLSKDVELQALRFRNCSKIRMG